jgi:hypothetical protein
MMTYQDAIDLARIPLNDADNVRVSDAQLLSFANHGVLEMVKRRPDLFIGQYGNLPQGANVLTDAFPLPAAYVQTVADYITFRAETIDDEKMNNARAINFMQLFGLEAPS